jgi:hypothetical protein
VIAQLLARTQAGTACPAAMITPRCDDAGTRLLDENLVSTAARRERDALRYDIAVARRY